MNKKTFGTLNVGGLFNRNDKVIDLFEQLKNLDVICLQETHFLTVQDSNFFKNVFSTNFHVFSSNSDERYAGIAIGFNRKSLFSKFKILVLIPGRAAAIVSNFDSKTFIFVNVYVPANRLARPVFFGKLLKEIETKINFFFDEIILMGDFNFVEQKSVDRMTKSTTREQGTREFEQIKTKLSIIDTFRFQNPTKQEFSFFSGNYSTMSRIDRIYTSESFSKEADNFIFKTLPKLDHKLVMSTFDFSFTKIKRGPSYWKMNTLLLETEETMGSSIEEMVANFQIQNGDIHGVNFIQNWDRFKIEVADYCKLYSKQVAKKKRQIHRQLESNIENTKIKLISFPTSAFLKNELEENVTKLDDINQREIQSRLHKTHFYQIAHDRHTLLTAKLLQKRSAEDRLITSIKTEDGNEITEQTEIIKEIRRQYKKDTTSKGQNPDDVSFFLSNPNLPKLEVDDGILLDGEVLQHEVEKAVKSFKKRKTPGSDGLPIEFYKKFEENLIPILTKLYNEIFKVDEMSSSMYYGIISQLYKGKGDRTLKQNWRPLTMLNVDYKILAKVLLNRIKPIAEKLVHPNQNCSVPGRDIRDGVLTLINLIDLCKDDESTFLLLVDHKAAFDVVEWEYIFQTLKTGGFSENFIKWLKIIYKTGFVSSSIIVNGFISHKFNPTTGIRQGCPLSASLYVLVNETVCQKIRDDNEIKGIKVQNVETKLSGFADDTNFILDDFTSAIKVLKIYEKYKGASGATLNKNKTKVLLLGKTTTDEIPVSLVEYLADRCKIYGFTFDSKGLAVKECLEHVYKSFSKLSVHIPHCEFSLESKIQFINTYYLSKLWYVASFLYPPDDLVRYIEGATDRFLWYPSPQPKRRKEVLKNSKDNGGIGYTDVATKVKAMRLMFLIRSMLQTETKDWKGSFNDITNNLRTIPKVNMRKTSCPSFYREIVQTELEVGFHQCSNKAIKIFDKEIKLSEITTKKIYQVLVDKKFLPFMEKIKSNWRQLFNKDDINFNHHFALNFPKQLDAFTKDVHYNIVQNCLFTRSRLSHFRNKKVDQYCQFCSIKGEKFLETGYHIFVQCCRVQVFWEQINKLLKMNDPTFNLKMEERILGKYYADKNPNRTFSNIVLQIAQKTIWITRNALENGNDIDIFESFKLSFQTNALRSKRFMTKENHDRIFKKKSF